MAKTRFFRIAVEGATTDGRVIERDWIDQMATGYNPATYTASINCEHLRGYSPDAPFNSYGTVVALKAEDIDLQLDGKTQKRRALYAQLDANDQLVSINKAGQKLFTSCEIAPNFAATGKAGLVGLAVTDNPASLGTEMLQFSAAKPMFDARKLDKANLFTAAEDATIEMEAAEPAPTDGAITAFTSWLSGLVGTGKPKEEPAQVTPPTPDNDNFTSAMFAEGMGKIAAAIEAQSKATAKVATDLTALQTKLASTEAPGFNRPPASGGGVAMATDC